MKRHRTRSRWYAVGALAAGLWGLANFYQPTVVMGESMSPTLHSGRIIWVDRLHYRSHKPQRGEVIVFRMNGETYVKRVYRGPGESVFFVSNDGEWLSPIRETRAAEMRARYGTAAYGSLRVHELKVPDDCVFVLGDNYQNSIDSRELGLIPISAIVGRARVEVDATKGTQFEISPRKRHAASLRSASGVAPG